MKLFDTLQETEVLNLLNGEAVGFFPFMILADDSFYNKLPELCFGYYMSRSGEKIASSIFENITKLKEKHNSNVNREKVIGELLRSKFIDKWNRVYDSLVVSTYDVLADNEKLDTKVGTNQNKDTHNTTKSKTGNNSDVITYDNTLNKQGDNSDVITYDLEDTKKGTNTDTITFNTTTTDNGSTGTKEITQRTTSNDDNVFGFNSTLAVGDTTSNETTTETVTGNANENIQTNTNKKTGTEARNIGIDESTSKGGTESKAISISESLSKTGNDSRQIGINESETNTGTDTTDISINETITHKGRNVSGAELITEELSLRNTQIFFDIIYDDIDSIVALQIYN